MAGIAWQDFAVVWKDCTGYAEWFPSDGIERYHSIPEEGYNTKTSVRFRSPRIAEPLFYEARHYTDRSLYQLLVGKALVLCGRPTWGLVSFYYAAFFAAQATIRLRGTFFSKITYELETTSSPTHRLDVVNLLSHEYEIRKTSAKKGEHQRVWAAFYDLCAGVSARPGWEKFGPVTGIVGDEDRVSEMHRRHLINYVPSRGYFEVMSPKQTEEWCRRLSPDLSADFAANCDDLDGQLEVRALLRLELCLEMFRRIASQGGAYSVHHPKIAAQRVKYVDAYVPAGGFASRVRDAVSQ